jgi:hypothetical protein
MKEKSSAARNWKFTRKPHERATTQPTMLTPVLVAIIILITLAALRPTRRAHRLITRRPYNNRYSDATAARDARF